MSRIALLWVRLAPVVDQDGRRRRCSPSRRERRRWRRRKRRRRVEVRKIEHHWLVYEVWFKVLSMRTSAICPHYCKGFGRGIDV